MRSCESKFFNHPFLPLAGIRVHGRRPCSHVLLLLILYSIYHYSTHFAGSGNWYGAADMCLFHLLATRHMALGCLGRAASHQNRRSRPSIRHRRSDYALQV